MKSQLHLIKTTIDNYPYLDDLKPIMMIYDVPASKAKEAIIFASLYMYWLGITKPPQTPHFVTVPRVILKQYTIDFLTAIDLKKLGDPYGLYEAYLSIESRRQGGVWYTPQQAVDFIVHNTLRFQNKYFPSDNITYIDFALGSGVFANTLYSRIHNPNIMGFEVDLTSTIISILILQSLHTQTLTHTNYLHQDYLEYSQTTRLNPGEVPIIIGNPPYGHCHDFKYPPITDYYTDSIDEHGYPQRTFAKNKGIYHNYKDLYICFIKASQDIITRAGKGILACIVNDSFTINNSFVGMRFNLLNYFNYMYIINLNGGVRQGGGNIKGDKSIFDIKTSTCILFLIRTHNPGALTNNPSCEVYYDSITGSKEHKLDYLTKGLDNIIDI